MACEVLLGGGKACSFVGFAASFAHEDVGDHWVSLICTMV